MSMTVVLESTIGRDAMNEQFPLPYAVAAQAVIRCVASTVELLAHGRVRLPRQHVGMRLHFADGSSARVYRETVVDRGPTADPCVLVVEFQLRGVRGWGHTLFRWESLLNTPLFVGFPGFVSKLWLAHDEHGVYRGVYEWDGPARAEHYARCLWRILALGCVPGSIRYTVLPGLRRDEVLRDPHLLDARAPDAAAAWWRLVAAA
jgi:hypothetical protein